MNLPKAIEILTLFFQKKEEVDDDDLWGACLMGIEALERVKAYKEAHMGLHYEPLPGETKD